MLSLPLPDLVEKYNFLRFSFSEPLRKASGLKFKSSESKCGTDIVLHSGVDHMEGSLVCASTVSIHSNGIFIPECERSGNRSAEELESVGCCERQSTKSIHNLYMVMLMKFPLKSSSNQEIHLLMSLRVLVAVKGKAQNRFITLASLYMVMLMKFPLKSSSNPECGEGHIGEMMKIYNSATSSHQSSSLPVSLPCIISSSCAAKRCASLSSHGTWF